MLRLYPFESLPPDFRARLGRPAPTQQRSLRSADVQVRTTQSGTTLSGYAAVFNSLSIPTSDKFGTNYRESIAPGAFASSLASGQEIVALWNHDKNHVLASTKNGTLRLWEDDRGLAFSMTPIDSDLVRQYILPSVADGRVYGMSFSFRPTRETWSQDRRTHTLFEADLVEISPVIYPAYPQTSVSIAGSVSRSASVNSGSAPTRTSYLSPEARRAAAGRAFSQAIDDAPHLAARRAAIAADARRQARDRDERRASAHSAVTLRGF